MNTTANLYQDQNKAIVSMEYDSIETNIMLAPSHGAILPDPSIIDVVVSNLAPASIRAQSIIATPSETPCVEGTCTVNVNVTWINDGGTSTFVPNIIIDGNPLIPAPYPSELLEAGSTVTKTFTVTGLTVAVHTICPSPNAPVYQTQTIDIIVSE